MTVHGSSELLRRLGGMAVAVAVTVAAAAVLSAAAPAAHAGFAPQVKDLATLEGVRGNSLYGYGLVVGLNGTGDRRQTLFTNQSLKNLLERQGITLGNQSMRVSNVAGVIVTTTLTAFARPGSPLDINVASIGDATSLRGGVLLLSELKGADGQVYATAQGPLIVGGAYAAAEDGASSAQSNHPTVARIPGGAVVERTAPNILPAGQPLSFVLNRPDFTVARRLAEAINLALGDGAARAIDARRVQVDAAARPGADPVTIAATVERLRLVDDGQPRVVVNERTGTIVAGLNVPLKPVSIVHGGLTIDVRTEFEVAQPAPFGRGDTTVVPHSSVDLNEHPATGLSLDEGATVGDLVRSLTALGASATDIISILQLVQEAGALEADLVVL